MEELKEITIEEWNQIPKDYIKSLFSNSIKRCKKVIEVKGARLEPEHLRDIRNEMAKEKVNGEKIDEIKANEEEQGQNLKFKLVYSKNELIKKSKKEIALIKKKIKDKKKNSEKLKKHIVRLKNILKEKEKFLNL